MAGRLYWQNKLMQIDFQRLFKSLKQKTKSFFWSPRHVYERYVLILGLVFGLSFVFLIAPMQGADEPNHFMRAYQLSAGDLVAEKVGDSTGGINPELRFYRTNIGGQLPAGIVNVAQLSYDMHGIPQRKMTQARFDQLNQLQMGATQKAAAFPNTAAYSPVAYAPSVIGIWIGRLFHARPLQLMYLARIASVIIGVLMLTLATYLMPVAKLPFAVIALLPMTIGELAVVSADTMALASSFLGVALFLHYIYRRKDLSRLDWGLLVAVSAVIALNKQALIPLLLVLGGLLFNKAIPKRKALLVVASCLAVALGLGLYWNELVKEMTIFGYHQSYLSSDYHHQAFLLMHHPSRYFHVLYEALATSRANVIIISFIGAFGWLDTYLPLSVVAFGVALIALATFIAAGYDVRHPSKWLRWLLILSGLGVTFATATLLFLLTMSPTNGYNLGLQGRYLIPAVLLLVIGLALGKKKRLSTDDYLALGRRCLYGSAVLLAIMSYTVALRYY